MTQGEALGVSRSAVESVAGRVDDATWARVEAYAGLLSEDARRLSLISHRAASQIGYHVLDSAAVLGALRDESGTGLDAELVDLGTGGGLPGLVIAILRERTRVVLVDSRNAKVVFLKRAVRELGLGNVEVVHERIEALAGRRQFDLAVSRALGSLRDTLAPSLRLLGPAGRLVLFKGPGWAGEEEEAMRIAAGVGCDMGWLRKVDLPGLDRQTWFVEFHVKRPGA